MAKSPAQLDREISAFLATKSRGGSRKRGHSTKARGKAAAAATADVAPGLRAIAQRSVNAENSFLEYAMEHGKLTLEQARTALAAFRKARAIKLDAVSGQFNFTHGAFGDPDVLRRAAGLDEGALKRSHMGKLSTFEKAKAEGDLLESEVAAADAALKAFPRSPLGGTSDSVRAMPEFRTANTQSLVHDAM